MVKRVNRKKILLLRFDNFEEGAKLTFDRLCFLLRGEFDSVPYVRVSASIAFHEDSFKMNCYFFYQESWGMMLFMAHKKILIDWQ